MRNFPPVVSDPIGEHLPAGVFRSRTDPAKYIIQLRRFERPKFFISGGDSFEWPLGTEGVRVAGAATLAEHKYIGDNASVVQVIHLDSRRIEMNGLFPGKTADENVRALLDIISLGYPPKGKWLILPGIFPLKQQVKVETYDFSRVAEDSTGSWSYSVTFIREGIGAKIRRPKVTSPPENPSMKPKNPKGKASRVFVAKDGARTLRAIAQLKYKDSSKWRKLYDMNRIALDKLGIPLHKLPTSLLPLGTKIRY